MTAMEEALARAHDARAGKERRRASRLDPLDLVGRWASGLRVRESERAARLLRSGARLAAKERPLALLLAPA